MSRDVTIINYNTPNMFHQNTEQRRHTNEKDDYNDDNNT